MMNPDYLSDLDSAWNIRNDHMHSIAVLNWFGQSAYNESGSDDILDAAIAPCRLFSHVHAVHAIM